MALVATVSKARVIERQDKLWNVSLNMVLTDDGTEVVNKDYSVAYRPNDVVADKQTALYTMMAADKAKYVSEQTIFDAAALDAIVANIESLLNG
ncbi:MAG: hypothetical protein ACXQS5_01820 [Candidatus Methanospirareceae archaeon]